MLAHPRIVPYLHEILGKGFRLDHLPSLIGMRRGAEGHQLHGSSGPGFDPHQYYIFQDGRMHNGLTVVTWQLTDVKPRRWWAMRGSRQSQVQLRLAPGVEDLRAAPRIRQADSLQGRRRGDLHRGGNAWDTTLAERPSAAVNPVPLFAGAISPMPNTTWTWPEAFVEGLSEEQRAVMEAPYHLRLERTRRWTTRGYWNSGLQDNPVLAASSRSSMAAQRQVLHVPSFVGGAAFENRPGPGLRPTATLALGERYGVFASSALIVGTRSSMARRASCRPAQIGWQPCQIAGSTSS